MLYKRSVEKIKNQGSIILKSSFLSTLSPLQRYEFLQFCHRREYIEGEYIYYQNDPGTGLYFIENGQVQLLVEQAGSEHRKQELMFSISQGERFGEFSVGYDVRRMCSARCLSDCVLLGFFKPDFETLKKRQPDIAVKFLESLTNLVVKQLDSTTRKLEESADILTAFKVRISSTYDDDVKKQI
ncbi:MAG: cyclic nucleotide-binding domain-containing protein [Balneolaceae bacterium]